MAELKQALLGRLAGGVNSVNAAAATTGGQRKTSALSRNDPPLLCRTGPGEERDRDCGVSEQDTWSPVPFPQSPRFLSTWELIRSSLIKAMKNVPGGLPLGVLPL
jgi:hypothetical protein